MTRHRGAGLFALLVVVTLGCSSNPAPSQDGGTVSNADAFVQVTVCAQPWLLAGQAASDLPVTVHDGDSTGTDMFSVTCSVRSVGAGFDVALTLQDQGPQGGSLTVTSRPGTGGVTASGGSNITATFVGAQGEVARGTGCTITPTYQGQPVPVNPSVFAGKIWGHVSCPNAVLTSEAGARDAAGAPCDAEADFLFENCSK